MRGILITGSGKRIGAALARGFAADGWHVFVHYLNSAEPAEALAAAIRDTGAMATPIRADLSAPDQVTTLFEACLEMAPVECVINNASLFPFDNPARIEPGIWDPVMQVNLRAPVVLASQLHEDLRRSGRRGILINILDNKLSAMNPDYFTYTLSKAALQTATEAMAMAFGRTLRCAGIAPGITLASPLQTEDDFRRSLDANPLHRGSRLEDLLAAARFIVATESYSGQVLTIDGGLHLARPIRDIVFLE